MVDELQSQEPYVSTTLLQVHQLICYRTDFVATIGEFIGTTLFLFFAFAGTQVANIGAGTTTNTNNGYSPIVLLYISTAFGFSLMVNVWIFFRISGGMSNRVILLDIM